MNYTGKLYGKVGRTYIPLVMTSDDVDDMEKKLTEVTLLSEGRLTLLNNQEQRHNLELAAMREHMQNNPWCAVCKETDCCVSSDGTCAMIRKYLEAKGGDQ